MNSLSACLRVERKSLPDRRENSQNSALSPLSAAFFSLRGLLAHGELSLGLLQDLQRVAEAATLTWRRVPPSPRRCLVDAWVGTKDFSKPGLTRLTASVQVGQRIHGTVSVWARPQNLDGAAASHRRLFPGNALTRPATPDV